MPLFEPEETVGAQWHRLVGRQGSYHRFVDAAVELEAVQGRVAVMFRALGGGHGVRVAAAGRTLSSHRLRFRQRLGLGIEKVELATFDGVMLQLPPRLDLFPEQAENEALYEWLAAWFALAGQASAPPADLLQADVKRLRDAARITTRARSLWPGLGPLNDRICAATRAVRPRRRLVGDELVVEAAVLKLLGAAEPPDLGVRGTQMLDPAVPLEDFRAGRRYRPFLPVPMWGDVVVPLARERGDACEREAGGDGARGDHKRRRASRRDNDQTRRKDPLILNRFETIISLAEMVNLSRAVEDDDEEGARQAADDLDEIAVGQHERKASTRLKLELDLPTEEIETTPLVETSTYPEWDYTRQIYHRDHCRVTVERASTEGEEWCPDITTQRRIRRVRQQFEALRPKRQILHGQPDGDELDLSALVRSLADRSAGEPGTDRVYASARKLERDFSVAVLMDVSLSTDSWIGERRVLDVEKEALLALAGGLSACGDEHGIFTFTSRRRSAVMVRTIKEFDRPLDGLVTRSIQALRPGHYTRIGAAVRYVAHRLGERERAHRLLLLLTDGKPNDVDHYEGRYAIEDTRMAIREARRAGIKVFGITVDQEARAYFPYIFGPGAYTIFPNIARLPAALPAIYRQVTG